jgi:hypothetical protein
VAQKRRSKGPQRRSRKSVGRVDSSRSGRKTQPSSAAAQGGGGGEEGRTFSMKATKNPSTLVSEARRVAKESGATFRGDTTSGSFSGKGVKGRYKIEGGTVKVTITDKPTLASWSTVESKVKEFSR